MQLTSLIGTKAYQKQGFLENGKRVPLSAVLVKGNTITQIKTAEKEKYSALQLGIGSNKKANAILQGHSKKAGLKITPRFLKEIRVEDIDGAVVGSEINIAEVFTAGDIVDVIGTSKGKGWAGGVKRYGFQGGPKTHGQSDRHRAPGSIGQGTTPGRVYKGKRMAGRMGTDTVTIKNLEIIEVTNDGVLLIKGLVPGSLNGLLVVTKVGVNKKFVPLYKDIKDEPVQVQEVVEQSEPEPTISSPENGQTTVSTDESQKIEEVSEVVSETKENTEIPAVEVKEEVK